MLTLYLMMAFTDAEPDIDARNEVYGNMFIGVIGLYLAVHATLMFIDICKKIKDGCKKLYTKLCKRQQQTADEDPVKEGKKYELSQDVEKKRDRLQAIEEEEDENEISSVSEQDRDKEVQPS